MRRRRQATSVPGGPGDRVPGLGARPGRRGARRADLRGGGWPLPYAPLIAALRPRLERENAPDDLLGGLWLAELARLLPELRERYPDLPPVSEDETVGRGRLFEAVARLAQALVERVDQYATCDSRR
jgi:hypothetical protein